jgi:hypothetical protein
MSKGKIYGNFGWKEFLRNRKDILAEFDRAKELSTSRPVKTEHGIAGEAGIRRWLSAFLPGKYGVTSGYIIPDIIAQSYALRHYDVIIYDKINSPVLWVQEDADTSEQGKKRAIPAKYTCAILEVKSSLSARTIKDSLAKLAEINPIGSHFPLKFSSYTIFFDLPTEETGNWNLLKYFLQQPLPHNYYGGMVLRSNVDIEMTGLIRIFQGKNEKENLELQKLPLAKSPSELRIQRDAKNNVTLSEPLAGVMAYSDGSQYHFSKQYGPVLFSNDTGLSIEWSYNGFTAFTIDLLSRIEERSMEQKEGQRFGQVFDVIE